MLKSTRSMLHGDSVRVIFKWTCKESIVVYKESEPLSMKPVIH